MDQEKLITNIRWLQAMSKLERDKSRFTDNEIDIINECIDNNETKILDTMRYQIYRDISRYPKYECIALWVRERGLIDHEPEFVRELVKIFGIGDE